MTQIQSGGLVLNGDGVQLFAIGVEDEDVIDVTVGGNSHGATGGIGCDGDGAAFVCRYARK